MGHGSSAGRAAVIEDAARPELDALEASALSFANELRAIDGNAPAEALLPGNHRDCRGCSIAATVNDGLDSGWWELGDMALRFGPRGGLRRAEPTTDGARWFMAAFDAGMYPHLEA